MTLTDDGRFLQLGHRDDQVKVYLSTNARLGTVSRVILDHGYQTLDLTTPGLGVLQMLRQGPGTDPEGSLDAAMLLAAPEIRWGTVNTENLGQACTSAAALIADVIGPSLP